jgi:anti-sigma B factor antagonist
MNVKLNRRQVDDIAVIDVSGRITLGEESNAIRNEVRNLTAGGSRKILLNLGDVSYIDSTGIGELVAGLRSAAKAGGSMKLLDPTGRVKHLLQMTNLNTIFETYDDEANALRSFV